MPTPSELAHAARAAMGADIEPARHINGRLPSTGNPVTQARERALQTSRELALQRAHNRYAREADWEAGRPERERQKAEEERVEAEQLAAWRATRYAKELTELIEANVEIQKFEEKIEALNERLFDTKQKTLFEPRGIQEILMFAGELPVLEKAIVLFEAEVTRCKENIAQWQAYGRGIVERIRNDLEQRLHEWKWQQRDLLKAEAKDQFFAKSGRMLGATELQDSPAFAQLESRPQLPSELCTDVEQWKAAIAAVEALIMPRESQVETPSADVAEGDQEINRSQTSSRRSKTSHAASR
jgi:hypothetical protein